MDGTPFGRYRLIALLGSGGMGDVWRALDTRTDRMVAIKVLHAHFAKDATFEERTGDALVFWDCYRPHDVQVRMFDVVPNPNWVAKPGGYSRSHEAGRSVDVTLARQGQLVDMGTDFDDFTPRGRADATDGVSTQAQANRARLRSAMATGGLSPYDGEWWHFDGPDADVRRPIINVPVH